MRKACLHIASILWLLGGFLAWAGCSRPEIDTESSPIVASVYSTPATEAMADELAGLHELSTRHPFQYYYLNSERAVEARKQLAERENEDRAVLRATYAVESLYAGQTNEAIDAYEELLEDIDPDQELLTAESRRLTDLLAISYLRQGEQQNCIGNHSAEACILPLKGGGIHTIQEGARNASSVYERLLRRYPNDYRSRWLLNVAYMALGRYPHAVPEEYLVPGMSAPYSSSFPAFANRAGDVGLGLQRLAGGVAMEDFNSDGLLDLFVTAHRLNDSVTLYVNDGAGAFVDVTDKAGLLGLPGGLNVVHADYNNDGFEDIFILRGAWLGAQGAHPNSLLKNNGDGTFEDVTVEAGMLSYHPTQTAAWADFNQDGWLDLFVGNEVSNRWLSAWQQSSATSDGRNHASELFINNGDGTFTDVAAQLGLDVELFVKGVAWGDANNDGLA